MAEIKTEEGHLIRVVSYEERIAELEGQVTRAFEVLEGKRKRIAELEKENAELRTKATALENANKAMVKELDDMTSGGLNILKNVVRDKDLLTKATDLLKKVIKVTWGEGWNYSLGVKVEAEQFISEVEK